MTTSAPEKLLSIAPVSRGIGYALFERVDLLVDWGTKEARRVADKNAHCLLFVERLIRLHGPTELALADWSDPKSRRSTRIKELLRRSAELASAKGVIVRAHRRADVVATFTGQGARTKYDIARVIARLHPELAPRLPRRRKPWQSEPAQMAIFEAVALAVAHQSVSDRLALAA